MRRLQPTNRLPITVNESIESTLNSESKSDKTFPGMESNSNQIAHQDPVTPQAELQRRWHLPETF